MSKRNDIMRKVTNQQQPHNQEEAADLELKNVTNPYNFVSFNKIIVPGNSETNFDSFVKDTHSGYIDLTITPKSNLFIRGDKTEFYKPRDNYVIPGSSIKGMVRSLVEVIAHGNVGYHEKEIQNKIIINKEEKNTNKTILPSRFTNPILDFANIMFGNNKPSLGKLIFEDAVCETSLDKNNFKLGVLKILSSPNPELSHYYQEGDKDVEKDVFFKGNKFYWHRSDTEFTNSILMNIEAVDEFLKYKKKKLSDYQTIQVKKDSKGNLTNKYEINVSGWSDDLKEFLIEILLEFENKFIESENETISKEKVLKHGCQNTIANVLLCDENNNSISFLGRIRYDNLTNKELGILLMALNLQQNCFHHIGMAKPYGLGRIKIGTTVTKIVRQKRYESVLEDDDKWNLAESDLDIITIKSYKDEATKYIMDLVAGSEPDKTEAGFWKLPRMKDLLDLHKENPYCLTPQDWDNKTQYHKPAKGEGKKRLMSVKDMRIEMNKCK